MSTKAAPQQKVDAVIEEDAVALFLDWLPERRAHGYRVKRVEALARGHVRR
jgi:hypothetical protein